MIVVDTSAMVALLDAADSNHSEMRELFKRSASSWLLPWAILPEVDYLVHKGLGARVQRQWQIDVDRGHYAVAWGRNEDLSRAVELNARYKDLQLGLVDAVVMSVAERLRASAIATFDYRHFGAVRLKGSPRLYPRDMEKE